MALYLVTGGGGFVGSNLVEALLRSGHDVRALDDFSSGRRSNLSDAEDWAAEGSAQFELIEGDIRTLGGPSRPLVVCNPPYWSPGDGPVSPDPLRAAARHELNGTLAELIAGMARVGGRLALVLPQRREGEAIAALAREGRPLRRRCRLGRRLVLLEGRPEPGPVAEESCGLDDDLSQVPAIRRWYARLGVPLRANPSRSGPPRES